MTPKYSFDEDVTAADEFEAVLEDLLLAALRNDIDVRGSWVYDSHDGAGPDLEVQFFELDQE